MNNPVIDGYITEPIGVQQIIKGVIKEIENPVTHKKTLVGGGSVLWDISQKRDTSTFILCRRTHHL